MFGNRCGNVLKNSGQHQSAMIQLMGNDWSAYVSTCQVEGIPLDRRICLQHQIHRIIGFFSGLTNFQTKNTKKNIKKPVGTFGVVATVSCLEHELGSTLFYVMAPDACRYLDHFTGLNLHEQHEAVKMEGFFWIRFSVQYTICSPSSFWVYTFYII